MPGQLDQFKERIMKHYNREAVIYDKTRFVEITWYKRINEEAFNVLQRYLKGETVLELGSGTGRFLIFCAKKGFRCTGIDISPEMIKRAEANIRVCGVNPEVIQLLQGDVEDESLYQENYYDNVICIKAFSFFPNPLKVVKNVHKCLKLGGRFILVYANNDSLYARIKRPESDLMRFYSFKDMETLLSPLFEIILKKRIVGFPGFIYRYFPRVATLSFVKKLDNSLANSLSLGTMSIIVACKRKDLS
jgi:ubiquinone/menaquinone biosynthesis C-methylase UbiE